jgi:hypothetical protein
VALETTINWSAVAGIRKRVLAPVARGVGVEALGAATHVTADAMNVAPITSAAKIRCRHGEIPGS